MKRISGLFFVFSLWSCMAFAKPLPYPHPKKLPPSKPLPVSQGPRMGVMVLAEKGHALISEAVRDAKLSYPVEVVCGTAEQMSWKCQTAIDNLIKKKIRHLAVVPLFLSSFSEDYQQIQFLFGLRPNPPLPQWAASRLRISVPKKIAPAFDHDPVVVDILEDRNKGIRMATPDSMILLAYRPISELANTDWLRSMRIIGDQLKYRLLLREVRVMTLRKVGNLQMKDWDRQDLRQAVTDLQFYAPVRVVSLEVVEGDMFSETSTRLDSLECQHNAVGLLPHPKISEWIRIKAGELDASF